MMATESRLRTPDGVVHDRQAASMLLFVCEKFNDQLPWGTLDLTTTDEVTSCLLCIAEPP